MLVKDDPKPKAEESKTEEPVSKANTEAFFAAVTPEKKKMVSFTNTST